MTVRPCSLFALCSVLVILTCVPLNVGSRKVLSRVTHLHFHGSGAWFRLLDAMMDSAALQVLVAEAVAQTLLATATARDNAGGSSVSFQIHKHYARLEKLVPRGLEGVAVPIRRGYARLQLQARCAVGDRGVHGTRRGVHRDPEEPDDPGAEGVGEISSNPRRSRTCVRQERLSTRGKARLWS